ncbi:unnamed protein product, partial [Iphiclides podalirius]
MRFTFLLLVFALVLCSGFGAYILRAFNSRIRRSAEGLPAKGHTQAPRALSQLEMNLKKGEYVCGNRICKLRPGEVPPNCNGVCQYPIH